MTGPKPILSNGDWHTSRGTESFEKRDPRTGTTLGLYPISPWEEVSQQLEAGVEAYESIQHAGPEAMAGLLESAADRLDGVVDDLVTAAHEETALGIEPRLRSVELPRTTDQLRQAARAVRDRGWTQPTLSPRENIASMFAPIPGPVAVFGPNNFPFAFNSVSGGDAAAALATGHPILAKANPGHPETTKLLAEQFRLAAGDVGVNPSVVQLVYRTTHQAGERLVADERLAATAYTGSRQGGLVLKRAAEAAGNLIYLEMSSVNPVVILPGALEAAAGATASELADSLLLGVGQFCTSPGLIFVPGGNAGDTFMDAFAEASTTRSPAGTLLGPDVAEGLATAVADWEEAGARIIARAREGEGLSEFATTLLSIDAQAFLAEPVALQREAFGNAALIVRWETADELRACVAELGGNLTGTIFSTDADEDAYSAVEPILRRRVGRLLNDKAPTGVAVVAAMNHGGPFPSTGHPGFTAVGFPASLRRFSMLQCYDNVPDHRLPPELQAGNPLGLQRWIDGRWTTESVVWGQDPAGASTA